jgi:SAM-dependent methyltransferase
MERLVDANKAAEIDSAVVEEETWDAHIKPFGARWKPAYFTKWATINNVFVHRLGLRPPARILDVGCGGGWTSVFLAETGFQVTGIDIAPPHLETARERAQRWQVNARFIVTDIDDFDLRRKFDACLVFDALHHSNYPDRVVANISRHLRTGGWVLFGEPSWLHYISPEAKRTHRDMGWIERGVPISSLKHYCRAAGLGQFRRFFAGSEPYENRVVGFAREIAMLTAANFWVAPQRPVWLAARKLR